MSRKKAITPGSEGLDPEELVDATLTRKQVVEMLRRGERFDDADLRGADLSGLCFDRVSMVRAKFAESNVARASFRDADLTGASFFGANLKDVCLNGAKLEDADFDFANLDGATLLGAKTRKALFPLRKLSLADVRAAVDSGAKLRMEAFSPEEYD